MPLCSSETQIIVLTETSGAYYLTEKSGWGVESITVSDLPVYCRIATSVHVML